MPEIWPQTGYQPVHKGGPLNGGIGIYPRRSFPVFTFRSSSGETMKIAWYLAILLIALLIPPMAAQTVTLTDNAASQVSVTSVVLDPAVLMQGDRGLVIIEVTNTGSQSVPLDIASIFTKEFTVVNENAYLSLGTLGAGNKMTFTYTLEASVKDGVYYPVFSLSFRNPGSDSLRYPIAVKVESSKLQLSVIAEPDTFSPGRTDAITLLVGNPREDPLNGIILIPEGEGINFTQKSYFVGDLTPGTSRTVIFNITPSVPSTVTFTAQYRNGINDHAVAVSMPVRFGTDKTRADPVVNNFQLSQSGSIYTLTGDVTNAGLSDARGVVVTVGPPARPVDPNPVSPIGSLQPDDLSSFEISFTASNLTEISLLITYKDMDGNTFQKTTLVNLSGGALESTTITTRDQGIFGGLLIPVLVIIVIGFAIIVVWRRGIFRRKPRK
jgi:hypothetical protein